ncbi:hypothetical protein CB1_000268002 [Camelus ferus]|nr:hypothetical protein CB1_000268002 [Camelus ferus]
MLLVFAHQQKAQTCYSHPLEEMNGCIKARAASRIDFSKNQRASWTYIFQGPPLKKALNLLFLGTEAVDETKPKESARQDEGKGEEREADQEHA